MLGRRDSSLTLSSSLVGVSSVEGARTALRSSLKGAKRVVIKAGTAVVSQENGLPSLPRIGMLVEQIAGLKIQLIIIIIIFFF